MVHIIKMIACCLLIAGHGKVHVWQNVKVQYQLGRDHGPKETQLMIEDWQIERTGMNVLPYAEMQYVGWKRSQRTQ